MNNITRIVLVAVLAFAFLPPTAILAAENEGQPKKLHVEIEGAKKTSPRIILREAKLTEGAVPEKGVDPDEVKKLLLNTHLFSEVNVSIEETPDATVVRIKVKERFTPVPIPVVYTSKEETGGGVFVLEPNLLGLAKVAILGAVWSTRGMRFQAIYMDDDLLGSKWALFLRGVYGDNELRRFSGDDEIFAYRQKYTNVAATIGYKITDRLIPSVGVMYRTQVTSRVDDYPEPPSDLTSNSFLINVRYSRTNYIDYYDRGFSALIIVDQASPLLGSERTFTHVVTTADITEPLWKSIITRIALEWGVGEGNQDVLTFYRLGGDVGARGLPSRGMWVPRYGSFSVGVEEPVLRHKFGTLTVSQFSDVLLTTEDAPVRSYPSVGVGIRAYIKQLAVPAIGADVAYSTWTKSFHVNAFIGKSF